MSFPILRRSNCFNTCWIFQSIFHIFAELTLAWTWPQLSPKRAINCSFNRALGAGAGWHRVNGLKSWWELSTPPPKYFEIYPEDKNDLPPHSKHWISFYGLRLKLVFIVPYNSLVLNKQNLVCVTQRAPGAGYITVLPALAVTISHSAQLWDHTPGLSYAQSTYSYNIYPQCLTEAHDWEQFLWIQICVQGTCPKILRHFILVLIVSQLSVTR